eukprot:TRINITY_DN33742_c0_g1_i2.p1 TRINITY_DN33742_c0_g1~~TRINITY_DN33742_c0_g1_i2.p1  ORF type:complete len:476 (+),score=122.92 TRINITY_DN33742_c0_g1_i2:164-1429(+)
MDVCRKQLQKTPDDRYVLEMRSSVQAFLDAAEDLDEEEEEEDEELPPHFDEMAEQAEEACRKAYDAIFAYLRDEEHLWSLGEQAIGIFWDSGQLAPPGPRKERLREMALDLTRRLGRRLKSTPREGAEALSESEWLYEGLGQLWFHKELGIEESWLQEGCLQILNRLGGRMQELVGYTSESLHSAATNELRDVLMQVWTLERSAVCGLFDGHPAPPPLAFGVREVLAEIRRRSLVEPPLAGFYHDFYLMTQVASALSCSNGCLPSRRSDCPWLFSYLERCLPFWLRQGKRQERGLPEVTSQTWESESVEAVAAAVDCLRGLEEGDEGPTAEAVREGCAWLLSRQEADGWFWSPNATRPPSNEYSQLHPTWSATAALQLDRQAPGGSTRSAIWAEYVRAAAMEVGFAEPPPPAAAPETAREA